MLYDKRWDKPEVKADPFTLPSLIAWLETMPAHKVYCFMDNGNCLLGQYYRKMGYSQINIGGHTVTLDGVYRVMPDSFSDIPAKHPRTFGAALSRARKALAS